MAMVCRLHGRRCIPYQQLATVACAIVDRRHEASRNAECSGSSMGSNERMVSMEAESTREQECESAGDTRPVELSHRHQRHYYRWRYACCLDQHQIQYGEHQ